MKTITLKTIRAQLKALNKVWKKASPKQAIYQAPNKRLLIATGNLDFLKGSNVLDIGCNQGLHSLMLADRAKKVVGIEVTEGTYKRALCTQRHFQSLGHKSDNVSFVHTELKDFEDYREIDAILSCCCIYNMNTENIERFMKILKQCNKIIYQTRPAANNRTKDRSIYKMCLEKDVIAFLKKEGFTIVSHEYSETKWPVIYAERK